MSFAVNLDLKEIFLSELRKTEKMLFKWTYKSTILIWVSLFDWTRSFDIHFFNNSLHYSRHIVFPSLNLTIHEKAFS